MNLGKKRVCTLRISFRLFSLMHTYTMSKPVNLRMLQEQVRYGDGRGGGGWLVGYGALKRKANYINK